jgi:hypothetical protein
MRFAKMMTVVLATGLLGPGAALAADTKGGFAVHGAGAALCSSVNDAAKANQLQTITELSGWIAGYLSAYNRLTAGVHDIVPTNEMQVYARLAIANCERNAGLRLETVMASLLQTMQPLRVAEESPFVTIANDKFTVTIRSSMIREVQAALVRARHLTGAADGVWGRRSEEAIRKFQEQAKLPETGIPDVGTLSVLLAPRR